PCIRGRVPAVRARGAVRRAGLVGERRGAAPARERGPAPARGDRRLRAHGSRAQGPGVGDQRRSRADLGPGRGRRRRGRARAVTVRLTATVPATSANLGPGFDCFGLALDLCNEVALDTDAEPGVTWEGEGAAELPTDGTDLLSRALAETAARFERIVPLGSIHGRTRLPLARRLGASG